VKVNDHDVIVLDVNAFAAVIVVVGICPGLKLVRRGVTTGTLTRLAFVASLVFRTSAAFTVVPVIARAAATTARFATAARHGDYIIYA
jgi:hypothetical protein